MLVRVTAGATGIATMASDLLRCLVCTQTPDTATRIAAEQELQHYSTQHGFGLALLEVWNHADLVCKEPLTYFSGRFYTRQQSIEK